MPASIFALPTSQGLGNDEAASGMQRAKIRAFFLKGTTHGFSSERLALLPAPVHERSAANASGQMIANPSAMQAAPAPAAKRLSTMGAMITIEYVR